MFSLLLRPGAVPPGRRGWVTLLAGVAVAEAVRTATGIDARLKWPNDLLARDAGLARPAKLAGILAEASGDAIVVGVGLNVSTTRAELPPPRASALPATSLHESGASHTPEASRLDREALLVTVLAAFERWYQAWLQAAGDPEASGLRPAYLDLCDTIGRRVRAELPGDQLVSGLAAGVDSDGRLLVRDPSGAVLPVAAGDVVHLRLFPGAKASAAARQAAGTAGTR
jgi:BirA family biotin operon repressor/biotin-[acetyl-CoA-carboxylase] ligase